MQAGFIGTVLTKNQPASFQTASLSMNESPSITRDLSATPLVRALVRFNPDVRVGDVTALLDKYQASIVEGATEHIARYKLPKSVIIVDRVQRAANGKADYPWAREVARSGAAAEPA